MADVRVIVIAVDESEYSDHAFQYYMDNIYKAKDNIILVHCPEYHAMVYSPAVPTDVIALQGLMEEEEKRVKILLEKFGDKLRAYGIGGKVKSVGGTPGEAIVRVAKENNATAIITGTRGMGAIRRTFLGSVSDYIIHHAHCPVLVCREKPAH